MCVLCIQDEVRKSKGVGLIKGLRETLGFKPYFYLLMINIFSWLGFQVLGEDLGHWYMLALNLQQYDYDY